MNNKLEIEERFKDTRYVCTREIVNHPTTCCYDSDAKIRLMLWKSVHLPRNINFVYYAYAKNTAHFTTFKALTKFKAHKINWKF